MALGTVGVIAACSSGSTNTVYVTADAAGCGDGSQMCGSSCTVVARDPQNCGKCGTACATGQVCAQGVCAASCGGGTTTCGQSCVDTKVDGTNCGACGTKCNAGEVCSAGKCGPTCAASATQCGNSCVNAQVDPTNCGACGTLCNAGEACTAGKCQLSCQVGLTLCATSQPDGGVPDASSDASGDAASDASGDAGPVLGNPYCANLQSDNLNCGACGAPCGLSKACVSGACVNTGLIGTGTDPDPYRYATGPQQASCKAVKALNPAAADGIYLTHPASTDIKVYCDMTNGAWTYEAFGFGQFNTVHAGWTFVGGPDFTGTQQFRAAFEYLYNRDGGLTNIVQGWNSGNCCITNTTNTNWYAFLGGSYMYPANASNNAMNCNSTYSEPKIKLYLATGAVTKNTFTQAELANVAYSSACSISNNPGIFAKRYQ